MQFGTEILDQYAQCIHFSGKNQAIISHLIQHSPGSTSQKIIT